MGKIADSVKKVVKDVIVKPIKEVIDAPIRVVYDTLVKGKSFQDSLKKETADIIKAFGNASRTIYSEILKPLGVDDENFFGIGGWLGDKLGTLVKDVTYDDAYQSVGIAAIVAVTILTWGYGSSFALSAANYMTVAAYGAGVSSSFALMATWYATQIVVYFGMSALLGGIVYNDIFAGGTFFDATQAPNTSCSVGELPQFGQNLIRLEFPFSNYAGEYDKNLAGDSNYSVLRYKIPQ
jgi:hypothetical protein